MAQPSRAARLVPVVEMAEEAERKAVELFQCPNVSLLIPACTNLAAHKTQLALTISSLVGSHHSSVT